EMAVLLGNTRGSVILGGSVLSALTVGIAVEAAFSPSVLHPGLAGVVTVSLLGCVIVCWLRAAGLLLLASRPVLDQLNDHRWRTGAPLDPRVRWLSTPSIGDSEAAWSWAQVNMMLGAARIRRERVQSAGTWTLIAVMCVEGDPNTHVFVLVDGWAKIVGVTSDGHELTLALRGRGDTVGEVAGETTGYRNATVQAVGTVRALIVPYERFSSFLDAHDGADRAYRRMVTRRWNDAESMLRARSVTS